MGSSKETFKIMHSQLFMVICFALGSQGGYAPRCRTVYETSYTTTYDKQCSTTYEQQCSTSYETSYKTECSTSYEQQCQTVCSTTYAEECSGGYGGYGYGKNCKKVPHQSCKSIP